MQQNIFLFKIRKNFSRLIKIKNIKYTHKYTHKQILLSISYKMKIHSNN